MNRTFREQNKRWGLAKALYGWFMTILVNRFGIHLAFLHSRELGTLAAKPTLADGFDVRVLSQADLEDAFQRPELDISATFAAKAIAEGGYCCGAFYEGQLVSYIWRAFESTPIHDRLLLCFPRPYRYGYKALTLAEFRGLQLQGAIVAYTEQRDQALGYRYQLSFVESHNYPSLASDKGRGNQVIGYLFWINNRLLNWAWASKQARAKAIGVQLG